MQRDSLESNRICVYPTNVLNTILHFQKGKDCQKYPGEMKGSRRLMDSAKTRPQSERQIICKSYASLPISVHTHVRTPVHTKSQRVT